MAHVSAQGGADPNIGGFSNAPASLYTDAARDTFAVNYFALHGSDLPNDVTLTVLTVATAPEPTTWGVFGLGAAAILILMRRSRIVRA